MQCGKKLQPMYSMKAVIKVIITCFNYCSLCQPTVVTTQRTYPHKYYVDLQSCLSHWIHAIWLSVHYRIRINNSLLTSTEQLSLLYKHFRLPGHSVADMKVQILEKIYHSSENPVNIRLHRRPQELHWIKELGTAAPYGCNDQMKGVGTLSSASCKHTNVLGIFNEQQ